MTDSPPPILWTRSEALACAYCWCEFSKPETRSDSPEQYWLSITERARMEYRKIVKDRHVLAIAMRQAAPVFHPDNATPEQLQKVAKLARVKQPHRIRQIVHAVWDAFMPPSLYSSACDAERTEPFTIPQTTCPKCGMKAIAFICSERGCPVNGGAAHG